MTRHRRTVHGTLRGMPATPAGFAEVQRAELRRTLKALMRLRLAALPIAVAVIVWYWLATGASMTRLAIICAFFVPLAVYFAVTLRQERRRIGPKAVAFGFIGMIVLNFGACAITGGLDSPFVILLPAVAASGSFGTQ